MQNDKPEIVTDAAARSQSLCDAAAPSVGQGASPSNTAPVNSTTLDNSPIQVLLQGVDSLYLSYPGQLAFQPYTEFKGLKTLAQSEFAYEQAQAVYSVGGHYFEVRATGKGRFPYVLRDNAYWIQIAGVDATRLPLAYVQIASEWLLSLGVRKASDNLTSIIHQLESPPDDVPTQPQVSRADLYVDFVTTLPIDTLPVGHWVSRAKTISQHTVNRESSGYSIGLGGDLSCRLYNKTLEIEKSGKTYLFDLWANKGWDRKSTVWRLEFQYKRRILTEHEASDVDTLIERLGPIWRYATLSWLKLTIPRTTDATQSRWPLHPVWAALADVEWSGNGDGVSIPVRANNPPSDHSLFVNGLSGISSYMAREGITDTREAFAQYEADARRHHDAQVERAGTGFNGYLLEKASLKARSYNLPFPGVGEQAEQIHKEAVLDAADAYRKASDGE